MTKSKVKIDKNSLLKNVLIKNKEIKLSYELDYFYDDLINILMDILIEILERKNNYEIESVIPRSDNKYEIILINGEKIELTKEEVLEILQDNVEEIVISNEWIISVYYNKSEYTVEPTIVQSEKPEINYV